jgi:hypothetical protein
VFKDNESLGLFKSFSELSMVSENLCGIKFDQSILYKIIGTKGIYNIYDGYEFKHIKNNLK